MCIDLCLPVVMKTKWKWLKVWLMDVSTVNHFNAMAFLLVEHQVHNEQGRDSIGLNQTTCTQIPHNITCTTKKI